MPQTRSTWDVQYMGCAVHVRPLSPLPLLPAPFPAPCQASPPPCPCPGGRSPTLAPADGRRRPRRPASGRLLPSWQLPLQLRLILRPVQLLLQSAGPELRVKRKYGMSNNKGNIKNRPTSKLPPHLPLQLRIFALQAGLQLQHLRPHLSPYGTEEGRKKVSGRREEGRRKGSWKKEKSRHTCSGAA